MVEVSEELAALAGRAEWPQMAMLCRMVQNEAYRALPLTAIKERDQEQPRS